VSDFTHRNLKQVHDSAPEFGFGEVAELRFAKDELDCERTGFTYHRVAPNTPPGPGSRRAACPRSCERSSSFRCF